MNTTELLSQIDAEIFRLQEVRSLLSGSNSGGAVSSGKKKRFISAEARKRIGDAQRKRWAKQKSAAK